MLIEATRAPVRSNLTQTSQFGVHDAAKLFSILANLYSDPLMSVVRELICNAWDAGGFVRVVLPSATNPYFTVTDEGPGMSEEFMLNNYTQAGYSSKDHTNDQIGGFGLGRLSAMSVTDNYAITTRGNTYFVSLDERQVPQIVLADRGEGTGTSVRVPIKTADRSKLIEKVKEFLSWADPTTFEVIGATTTGKPRAFETESCFVYSSGDAHYYSKNHILLGPIAYELDANKAGFSTSIPRNLVMKFNIGELDLPPNRETVTYTERTVAAIQARWKKLLEELPPLLFQHLREMPIKARLQAIQDLMPLQYVHNEWMKSTGKRAEDKDVHWDEKKWGKFIENSLEWVDIPGFYRVYERSWRTGALKSKVASQGMDYRIATPSQFDTLYFYVDDKVEGSAWRYLQDLSARQVVVFSGDFASADEINKIINIGCKPLSRLTPSKPLKRTKSQPKVFELDKRTETSIADGDVWIGFDDERSFWPQPPRLLRLGKAAQRLYLNDTHRHYDVWRRETAAAINADPNTLLWLRAQESSYPHWWTQFFDLHPDVAPEATAEYQEYRRAMDLKPRYPDLVERPDNIKPLKFTQLERLIKKNPRLEAWVKTRFNGPYNDIDPTIFLTTRK